MAKISRRNFMKCAGAAALAVAAAGALSACNVSSEKLMDLQVNYTTEDNKAGTFMSQTYVGTKVVDTMTIPLPAELSSYIAVGENVPVQKKNGVSYVEITLKLNMVDYTVNYVCEGESVMTGTLNAVVGTTSFAKTDLSMEELAALEAKYYTVADNALITVNETTVTVAASKVMGSVDVKYTNYSSLFSENPEKDYPVDSGSYDETVKIWKGQNTISTGEMKNLKSACTMGYSYVMKRVGTTPYAGSSNFVVTDTFDIDWSNPVVKVYLSYSKNF